MLEIAEAWRSAYPGAHAGILVMSHPMGPGDSGALDRRKQEVEQALRTQFSGQDKAALAALPSIRAYTEYYKQFKKTYHVLLQLESVVFKGKSIPRSSPLVEAMFLAELETQLLTAGHDVGSLQLPIRLDVARGDESYTLMRRQEQSLKPGDMFMQDGEGVISSVIYGPDYRTRITPATPQALFAVYAPAGISRQAVADHLGTIQAHVRTAYPQAEVQFSKVYSASDGARG